MIRLENLSLRYKDKILTKNVNISFSYGKIYLIYGPSGSGKSSLLKAIGNINDNYEGKIIIDDKFKDDMFYVDTDNYFFKNNTVSENIKILCDDLTNLDYYIDRYNLKNILNQQMKYCSLGEQKRIIMICMFLNERRINLLDETLTNVDEKYLKLLFEDLLILRNKSLIIIVSHFKEEVGKIADISLDFNKLDEIYLKDDEDSTSLNNLNYKGKIRYIRNYKFISLIFGIFIIIISFLTLLSFDRIIDEKTYFQNILKDNDSLCFDLKNNNKGNLISIIDNKYTILFEDKFKINDEYIDLSDKVILSSTHKNDNFKFEDYRFENVIYYDFSKYDFNEDILLNDIIITSKDYLFEIITNKYGIFIELETHDEEGNIRLSPVIIKKSKDSSLEDSECNYFTESAIGMTYEVYDEACLINNKYIIKNVENDALYSYNTKYGNSRNFTIYVNENTFNKYYQYAVKDLGKLFLSNFHDYFITNEDIDYLYEEIYQKYNNRIYFEDLNVTKELIVESNKKQVTYVITSIFLLIFLILLYVTQIILSFLKNKRIIVILNNYHFSRIKIYSFIVFKYLLSIILIFFNIASYFIYYNCFNNGFYLSKNLVYYINFSMFIIILSFFIIELIFKKKLYKINRNKHQKCGC